MHVRRSKLNIGRTRSTAIAGFAGGVMLALCGLPAVADIDPVSGIDFVRITHPGNAPWPGNGNPVDRAVGRGRVDYEYSIGRMELTTSQAVEFFNAAYDRPQSEWLPHLAVPTFWGAAATQPTTPGGRRWTVPAGNELRPVGNLSWRMGAMICNWYHNGKSTTREAFLSGAYDVSTFGFVGNIFTDQLAHSPGARYWIPTWDEWLKAAHWSPERQHPTLGGWWVYSNGTDQPLVGAPPGVAGAQANFGWSSSDYPGQSPFSVPLGAYGTVGPWGLLDAAGGTDEWTESVSIGSDDVRVRISDGSYWSSVPGSSSLDRISGRGSEFPHVTSYEFGLRLASSVPAPGPCILGAGVFILNGCIRRRRRRRIPSSFALAASAIVVVSPVRADVDPNSGIDFVRITHPGNAPWPGNGNPVDRAVGRGGVGYEYSIGRTEVPTGSWVEFFNAAYDRPQSEWLPHLTPPTFWGASETLPTVPGGRRWTASGTGAAMPTGNISWRMAAMYCNWLCNGKSTAREAFLSGAYDVSTFGFVGNIFTDQLTHTPGAQYWIPTWDEWLKAAHFDPDRNGDGQPGWWVYSNGTDSPLVGGPPGVGQANFGFNAGAFSIPLGAYPQTRSPWGLLDVAGATLEWTESVLTDSVGTRYRMQDGSYWGSQSGSQLDAIFSEAGEFPQIAVSSFGFRIASSVPSPSAGILGAGVFILLGCNRRR